MKRQLLFFATTLLFFCNINLTTAQSYDDLKSDVEEFTNESQAIYRLDQESLDLIWDAYCGQLDPYVVQSKEYAAKIGSQMQDREEDEFEELIRRADALMAQLDQMKDDTEHGSDAKKLYEQVYNEAQKLTKLKDGVVLKGSNHPFTQAAANYGIEMHNSLCKSNGGNYSICNRTFPTMDSDKRPDLVLIKDDELWIYEFKPKTSKAISDGEDQVEDYLTDVVDYFERCFPNGREGDFSNYSGGPADDSFLKKIKECDKIWESDGKNIIAKIQVVTYEPCEKKFN